MPIYKIAWEIEGVTEIEAESEDEARTIFNELGIVDIAGEYTNLQVLSVAVKPEHEAVK